MDGNVLRRLWRQNESAASSMNAMPRFFLAGTMLFVAVVGRAQNSRETKPADLPGMQEAFAFIDRLFPADTRSCKFVEVTRPRRGRFGRKPMFGFLIGETEATFTVWSLDAELKEFRRDRDASFQDRSFESEAPRVFDDLSNTQGDIMMGPLGLRSSLICLGREFGRRGNDEMARRCCLKALSVSGGRGGGPKDRSLVGMLRHEIDTAWMWRAVLACADPETDRSEMLDGFRRYLSTFSDGRFIKDAQDMAQQLEQMVQEDVRHREESRPRRTEAEQIEELVYLLREQHGQQLMVPGHASAMASRRTGNAAWQLVAMGHAAVPRLIEAIGDRRLTRTVGCWRDFTFSHYVVRVGDCAVEILEQIAGRQFWTERSTFSYVLKDGLESEVRSAVLEWWKQTTANTPESRPAETRPSPR